MELSKSIRILELKTAIEHLSGNRMPSPAAKELLAEKQAELEKLVPPTPQMPAVYDDLSCTRAEITEHIAQLDPRATDVQKEHVRKTDFHHGLLIAEQNRLLRWDMWQVRKEWEAANG